MAIQRLLALISGVIQEYVPLASSAGAGSAGGVPALNGAGQLDLSFMPTGVGPDTQVVLASESISAGSLVNVYNNAGVATVRNADGTAPGKEANGFVLGAVASAGEATVYGGGLITGLSGLTPGPGYLSDTALGGISSTGATTAGHIWQRVGVAMSATSFQFAPGAPITRS